MSFNFHGPLIFDNSSGTPANPGAYLGFAQANLQSEDSSGPRIYAGTGDPNGVLTAPIGSMWIEDVTGGWYQNVNGAQLWDLVTGGGSGATNTIYDSGFISGPQATMDTGVLVIPTGTVHLRYMLLTRFNVVATYSNIIAGLNNDFTQANYISLRSLGDPAVGVLTAPKAVAAASSVIGSAPAFSAGPNLFGVLEGSVPFYAGAQLKQITGTSTDFRTLAGEEFVSTGAAGWNAAAVVSRIGFRDSAAGNFAANSRLIVYAQ